MCTEHGVEGNELFLCHKEIDHCGIIDGGLEEDVYQYQCERYPQTTFHLDALQSATDESHTTGSASLVGAISGD